MAATAVEHNRRKVAVLASSRSALRAFGGRGKAVDRIPGWGPVCAPSAQVAVLSKNCSYI